MELNSILKELEGMGSPEVKRIKSTFAISPENSCGIFLKELNALAKRLGKNDVIAIQLFDSGIYEARLLASMLFNPPNLTEALMDQWVGVFDTWEICDTFCMNVFGKSRFAVKKAFEWSDKEPEYQRRAGFVCMVQYAFTNKDAPNSEIRSFFPQMIKYASDDRLYVMKGINWALRQVGKRNKDLHAEAIAVAHEIREIGSKPAQWIARDALRQLQGSTVFFKNYPRKIYGSDRDN